MLEAIRISATLIVSLVVGLFFGSFHNDGIVEPQAEVSTPIVAANEPQSNEPKPQAPENEPKTPVVAPKPQPIAKKPATPVVTQPKPAPKPTPAPAPAPTPEPAPQPAPSPKPPVISVSAQGVPKVDNCQIFPADHPYNTDISNYPLHPRSDHYVRIVNETGTRQNLHPDFGGDKAQYGMPINIVGNETPDVPIKFTAYGAHSDPGPYPIPPNAKVQPNYDRHIVVLDKDDCKLYEGFYANKNPDNSWNMHSGAIWDLTTIHRRPLYWTSADGAGMAIYPLVVKYDEVAAGAVNHAIRMTVPKTYNGFIWPANHFAGHDNKDYPPMGLRFRLKADYDISNFPPQAKVILTAMKKYGMIVAQNGSSWVIGGEQHPGWDNDQLRKLKTVPSSAFEVVYTGDVITR